MGKLKALLIATTPAVSHLTHATSSSTNMEALKKVGDKCADAAKAVGEGIVDTGHQVADLSKEAYHKVADKVHPSKDTAAPAEAAAAELKDKGKEKVSEIQPAAK